MVDGNAAGAFSVVAEDDAVGDVANFIAAGFALFRAAMPEKEEEEEEAFEQGGEEPNRRANRTEARLSLSWRLSIAPSSPLL